VAGVLTGIGLFALKSARGIRTGEAEVEPWGLRGDRRWAVVDAAGRRVRAVELPAVMGVTAAPTPDGGLHLTAPHRPELGDVTVRPPAGPPVDLPEGAFLDVRRVTYGDDPSADRWLAEVVGEDVRLVWHDDPSTRPVSDRHGGSGEPDDVVSLADTGPLLLTSEASLRRLDDWVAELAVERGDALPEPLDMRRFRPNVVVDGFEPFAEDRWTTLAIGDVSFRVTEPCDRCAVTRVHPDTLERGPEPIRTLARFRRRDGLTWFGVRIAPTSRGTIRVGEPVVPSESPPVG
jgi:uncharacterized protein YcbX